LMSSPDRAARIDESLGPIQWIHGLDAARAALLAGSHEAARNQAFLVAAAASVNSVDLLNELWDITQPTEPNPFAEQVRARRVSRPKLDISKIRESLGFEPVLSLRQSLEEVLGRTEISPATIGTPEAPSAPLRSRLVDPIMAGKTCVITGATSGIGLATAELLAAMGARLILLGRDPAKGEAALKQIRAKTPTVDASLFFADLARLGEVRRVAAEILAAAPRIDVLLNNAGALFEGHALTEDGLERTFALNYMSHFLLTALLLDRLQASAPSRIIIVTSIAHRGGTIDFDDLENRNVANGYAAYQRAKLYCILFARELARRLSGTGVSAHALHPGAAATSFGDELGGPMGTWLAFAKQNMAMPPEKAAESMAYLASSPAVTAANGKYFDQGRLATPAPAAEDDVAAQRLWDESVRLVGL
jgi:NAD(P)-dependent dehydrogenase (short-subunit alcohol dehydrogenase family)